MKRTLINLFLTTLGLISISPVFAQQEILDIEQLLGNAEEIQNQMLSSRRTEAFLLVSFSMPEQSLNRLAQDAKDAGIPLVFRGVPYSETTEKEQLPLLNAKSLSAFKPLTDMGVQIELNPEIFEELGISQVPALVIRTDALPKSIGTTNCQEEIEGKESGEEKVVVVRGDVTLGYMLDTLLERNDEAGNKARELRKYLGGRQ